MNELRQLVTSLEGQSVTQQALFGIMADKFYNALPESLYMNQYQLEKQLGSTHEQWSGFLKTKEVDRYLQREIASIAEIAARQAIATLQTGNASSSDISAAKQLLETSKLLKQKSGAYQKVVIMHLPPKEYANGK